MNKFKNYTSKNTLKNIIKCNSISNLWNLCLKKYKNQIAIIDKEKEYTFLDIELKVALYRTYFSKIKSKRIGLYLKNSIDFIEIFLAIVTSNHSCVIFPSSFKNDFIQDFCLKNKIETVINNEVLNYIKDIKIEKQTNISFIKPNEEALVMFSSGTTDFPKGVCLSHKNVLGSVLNSCYGYNEAFNQKYLAVLPFFHVMGLIRTVLTSFYTGSSLILCNNHLNIIETIEKTQPTITILTPNIVEIILNLSKTKNKNFFGSLKYIIVGGEKSPWSLPLDCLKYGVTVLQGYGMTEIPMITGNPINKMEPTSVGYPLPNIRIKIKNDEIYVKSKNLFIKYIGDKKIRHGWFNTHDRGTIINGLIYLNDRDKPKNLLF